MGCAPFRVLRISDGTTSVDLLNESSGFYCTAWEPAVSEPKGGGSWRDSPLSSGRRLVMRKRANALERYTLQARGYGQDALIRNAQNLRRLLEKATQYSTCAWQDKLVWIEAQGAYETNLRYGPIHDYRAPSDGFPYGSPFEAIVNRVAFDDFALIVERGPYWLADQPGTGTCVEVSGSQTWEALLFCLTFNGATSDVNCGSDAGLDTLPTDRAPYDGFTAEAWILPAGYGENNQGRIFNKWSSPATGWYFAVDSTVGLVFRAEYGTQDSLAEATLGDLTADSEWHHVAMTFDDNPIVLEPRLWVDGQEVGYTTQQGGTGGYNFGESPLNLHIGNDAAGAHTFDGSIGWCRISNNQRYTADFDPPDRCVLPAIDADTIGQWIGPERSGAAIDNQEGTAARDGTQANCNFDAACDNVFGRTATCEDEVYVANKHNRAQLTDLYVDNGGAFGVNLLLWGPPYDLLPAAPVANDAVYFGIDTSLTDTGPFCSLVFDIATAVTGVTGIAWEYWNGAWVALTVQDNTNDDGAMTGVALDTTGVNSVHWEQPTDWVAVDLSTAAAGAPAVTGFWVRARVTAAAGATAPDQQNRNVYTVLWPYVEIDEEQVGGDAAALLQTMITNQSSATAGSGSLLTDVVAGLRSISRGDDFTAYVNISDEQNPTGITVTVPDANTTFQNYIKAPSGRAAVYNPAGVAALVTRITISFTAGASRQFYGQYRAYLRTYQNGGSDGDFTAALEIFDIYTTEEVTIDDSSLYAITDLGLVTISPINLMDGDDVFNAATINVQLSNSNAAPGDLYVIDLILIPVDEWAGQFSWHDGDRMDWNDLLDVDGLTHLRVDVRAFLRDPSDMSIYSIWQPIAVEGPILQANADQRLWLFTMDRYGRAYISTGHSMQMVGNQRYDSMRGDR
jgi:hypothetical protein